LVELSSSKRYFPEHGSFGSNLTLSAGLPDGIFSDQKFQFGKILVCPEMEDGGLFYRPLVYFTALWSILRPFGILCGNLIYFVVIWYIFPILVCCTKKNLAALIVWFLCKSFCYIS
jgi:hypothetical protein